MNQNSPISMMEQMYVWNMTFDKEQSQATFQFHHEECPDDYFLVLKNILDWNIEGHDLNNDYRYICYDIEIKEMNEQNIVSLPSELKNKYQDLYTKFKLSYPRLFLVFLDPEISYQCICTEYEIYTLPANSHFKF